MNEQPKTAIPKGMKILLVASLVLNIAVLGLIAGLALRGPTGAARPGNLPSDGLIGMHRALPDGPRRAVRREFFARREELGDMRHQSEQLRKALPELVEAEPVDIGAVRENLQAQRGVLANFGDQAMDVLVAGIEKMTPEERAEFAANLRAPRPPRRMERERD